MTKATKATKVTTPRHGWLRTPAGQGFATFYPVTGQPSRALLLCHAFGYERMVLHGTYRVMAERAAQAGIPALCWDCPGTADADGYPRQDTPLLTRWRQSLQAAADWLRQETGASGITVFGARLGATIGCDLACGRDDIDACVLWAPVLSGRAFVREQLALTSMRTGNTRGTRPAGFVDGDVEATGFLLTESDVVELRAYKLAVSGAGGIRNALVVPRTRTSRESVWVEQARASGVRVGFDPEPPFNLEQDVMHGGATPPSDFIGDVVDWLDGLPPPGPSRPCESGAMLLDETTVRAPCGSRVRERFVRCGDAPAIAAIVSEPLDTSRSEGAPLVMMVNGGHNYRPGINRNYVEWARSWAVQGLRVVRLDCPGLGDSPPHQPRDLQRLYLRVTRSDLRRVLDWAFQRWTHPSAVLLGLCAGAFQSYQCALRDRRVSGVVMVNPLRLFYGQPALETLRDLRRGASIARYREDPRSALEDGLAMMGEALRSILSWVGWFGRARNAFGRDVRGLIKRGARVQVVFDEQEAMLQRVERLLSSVRRELDESGRLFVDTIEDADHIFSPICSQQGLGRALHRWMEPLFPGQQHPDLAGSEASGDAATRGQPASAMTVLRQGRGVP